MPDDAIGKLGLDITPFRKAISDANAKMDSMSPTLAKVNAAIAQMEKQSVSAADAAKKHQTAVVNLGNELRKLTSIHVALGTENTKENRSRMERIEQLKSEIKLQSDLAAKARSNADASAASVEGAKKQRDKMAPSIQRADRAAQAAAQAENQAEKTEEGNENGKRILSGLSRGLGLGGLGIAGAIAAGIIGLKKFGQAALNFGDTMMSAGKRFGYGSQRYRDIQAAGGGGEAYAAGSKAALEQFVEKAKAKFVGTAATEGASVAANASATVDILKAKSEDVGKEIAKGFASEAWDSFRKSAGWLKDAVGDTASGAVAGMTPDIVRKQQELAASKQAEMKDRGNRIIEGAKELVLQEDKITAAIEGQVVGYDSQTKIMNEQLKLLAQEIDYYGHRDTLDRERANAAKQAYGQLQLQMALRNIQREDEQWSARAETLEMGLKQKGMSNIAEKVKIEHDYNLKILQAHRDQNAELETQLGIQKQLALNQNKADAHNLTPRQLSDERRDARKFARDVAHQNDREADMVDRIRSGVHGATPGSRLDRFMVGRRANAANAQNMTVNTITSTNMNVTNFALKNL